MLLAGVLPVGAWGQSQRPVMMQEFAQSTVVLTSGDTLRGSLALHQEADLLLITMPDNTVRTVPALAVRTFAVRHEIMRFDRLPASVYGNPAAAPQRLRRRWRDVQRARPFLVYPWNHDRDYNAAAAPAFFERLNGGPVILLRRQQLVQRALPIADQYTGGAMGYAPRYQSMSLSYTDVRELLYLATPQGQIVALRKPKRDLLAYFPAEAELIEQYARDHRLQYTDSFHMARLVDYANSLQQQLAKVQ
ncbi:hypothetical protein GCM10027048_25430 [Hymenobacter coalescens]